MDLTRPRFIETVENPCRLRVAFGRIREKLRLVAYFIAKPPAARLVLIGRPGTGSIMLPDQFILIEAAEPGSQPNRILQSSLNFVSNSAHYAAQVRQVAPTITTRMATAIKTLSNMLRFPNTSKTFY